MAPRAIAYRTPLAPLVAASLIALWSPPAHADDGDADAWAAEPGETATETDARDSWDGALVAGGCAGGAACRCPNGAWSTETCDATGMFRFCACAAGAANIDVPNIDFSRPKSPPKPKRRPSGVGMLIGGLITLGLGATSLGIGVQMIRDDTVVPLGVVLTATGGTAMLVGLPLSIVGLYYVATRNDNRGYYNGEAPAWDGAPQLMMGPQGVGVAF